MRRILVIALLLTSAPALAQSVGPEYVPITIDEAKMNAFISRLQDVAMPNRSYTQVIAILQDMERQAIAEKQAVAPRPPTPPTPDK